MGPIADSDVGMAPAARTRLRNGFGALIAAAVLCAFLAATVLAAGPLDFIEPASSPEGAGDTPGALAEADLDGDGDRDLAVTNQPRSSRARRPRASPRRRLRSPTSTGTPTWTSPSRT